MDFFQHRYYKLNKTLMTLVGYWPFQSTRTRLTLSVVLILILTSHIVPQMLALVKYRDEPTTVIECITTFLFETICATKGIGCVWNSQNFKTLLNRIRADWQVCARDREVNILHKYAEQGRRMSLAFGVQIYSVAFVYVAQPTIRKIIDVWLKNGTASGQFPSPVDYYHLDSQKYYFHIVMYTYVCQCVGLIPLVANEIMLIVYVQHVCGVLAALGCKLQRIGNNNSLVQSADTFYNLEKRDMTDLVSCIDRHNDVIDCANLIEGTHTWTIFYIIALTMIILNLVGLQILLGKSNPEETVKFVGFALAVILLLYVECYASQLLMDHSINIHLYIYDSQWYKLAPKAQKFLQLMIMRCRVPCKLTAGKFLILSMTTFAQVLRTAGSYFTVVRSMQIQEIR